MKFGPGNPGRPKGAISTNRRRFSEVSRELLDKHGRAAITRVLQGKNHLAVMRALEFLAAYGIGKPLDVHAHLRLGGGSIDPESPEGILLTLAGQPIPGLTRNDDDEETPLLPA